ncbi:MAG: antibiotic biosynthesis monooxygenase [Actinomycetota bacterium]
MRHMRMATYEITQGTFQEVADSAKTGMLPKFREQPGFVRYGVADVGDNKLVSISLWETHEAAEAAAPVAAAWVAEHIADRISLRENYVGDLAFYQGIGEAAPATV